MYAVIQTGGKQYRVRPGDLLVVDKLDGEPGAVVDFDKVLMIGEGASVTLGAPTVAGAMVSATLVETRKGKKIKVFKKIRRQGYRRTRGHRQFESVLRVTALAAGETRETWDGEVDLTPLSVLNARARNLAHGAMPVGRGAVPAAEPDAVVSIAPTRAKPSDAKKAAAKKAAAKEAPAKKAPAKKAPAKKAAPPAKAAAPEKKAAPSAKTAAPEKKAAGAKGGEKKAAKPPAAAKKRKD